MTKWILILNLFFVLPAFAQTEEKNIATADSIISFETMHVHFDKDIYLPGETIWFKAYLYNVNEISFAATNFYAAIYDDKGKLLQQKQYPIIEGSCNGDFEIPDTIEYSRLQFRAFTKAMIEEDSNNVYQRPIKVYQKNNADSSIEVKQKLLHFFVEGGQAIAELQNFFGFKAMYADGTAAILKGEIIEVETGKAVDTFATDSSGMGKLMLIPRPRISYKAVWEDDNGIEQEVPLPAIKRFGVSFHAEVNGKELKYSLARNKTNDSLSLLHILAQIGKYNIYKADLVLPNEMELATAKFPLDSLSTGLMQLTLFDKEWNKLQERLIFITADDNAGQVTVTRDTMNNVPKGRNILSIRLSDTLFTNLSVSIADINFYDQANLHSIRQDLLLNTRLAALTQNSDALLQSKDRNAIDFVLLSHQWRKFDWKKAIDKKEIKPALADNYISLGIEYKEKNLTLPANDGLNLIISNNGMGKQFYNVKPAGATTFKKSDLVFFDSAKVAYQMDINKTLVNYLTIKREDTLPIPQLINALPDEMHFTRSKVSLQNNRYEDFYTTAHTKFNDLQTIKGVVIKSKYKGNQITERINELDKFYTSGMFSGTTRGFQLNVIDDTFGVATNRDIKDYMRFRLPGLNLRDNKFGERRTMIVPRNGTNAVIDTIFLTRIFINEVDVTPEPIPSPSGPISPGDPMESLNMNDIAYIKYIPGIVIGAGFNTSTGAIFIYTKTGREKGPPAKGLPFVYIKGYNSPREFAGPNYSDKAQLKQPDFRTTLYWNPYVILDKTTNTFKIEYFNNDVSKKLLLKIEGVNAAGKLIYVEKILE
ncbi:hypothetical protein [Ferruginibacter sp. SUN106]|uniref:hypothetical protein n=1 Tax=Ferruginibacter sp. SUN106 TaxID=2978348 RepID=UPI003D360E91